MGFPWRKTAGLGWKIATVALPAAGQIEAGIDIARGLKGKDKQEAVVKIVASTVKAAEKFTDQDLVDDPLVQQATRSFVDAYVNLENVIADAKAKAAAR